MPAVGVVVLTHNRVREVCRTLARLTALNEAARVVVVDNGSTDGTGERLRADFPDVDLIRLTRNLGAAGRNAGLRALDTPYAALCDDDTWWAPGGLTRAAALLDAHPHLAVLTAQVRVEPGGAPDPACAPMAASPLACPRPLPGPRVLGFLAGACVVRRAAFLAAGGFEPRFFLGGEEALTTLNLARTGWDLAYSDALTVHHQPSPSRDVPARRVLLTRNALWLAWLCRPADRAWTATRRAARAALQDRAARRGLLAALAGAPWALARRRVIPDWLEADLRRLGH